MHPGNANGKKQNKDHDNGAQSRVWTEMEERRKGGRRKRGAGIIYYQDELSGLGLGTRDYIMERTPIRVIRVLPRWD